MTQKPTNGTLRAALRGDPARLRIRTREGEQRKQRLQRARRKAAERREAAGAPERRLLQQE
jgi:hypothetical protein